MHTEVINTIFSEKHMNLSWILRRGAQNLSICHPHKRPLKDMNDSSLRLHLERKQKQMDAAPPPPRESPGVYSGAGWITPRTPGLTHLALCLSCNRSQIPPSGPLFLYYYLYMGRKYCSHIKHYSFTHKHSQPRLRTVRTPLTFHPAGETRHQVTSRAD